MTTKLYQRAKKMVYLGRRPLYNYLIRPGSIMHSGKLEELYHNRTAVLTELLSYFRNQNLFDKYRDELEALTAFHGYFYSSLEILLVEKNRIQLTKCRLFVENQFPDFSHNIYIKKLSTKERLKFELLFHKQYTLIRLISSLQTLKQKSGRIFTRKG